MPITEGGRFSPVDRIVSPGVFTRENDLSGIAQGVADIGGAIVAPFPKGPAFTPTLITDVNTLESKFGVADGVYYGPYTAKEYLLERGVVTVCRVGALTGYKQNYPFVIWALKGTYARIAATGSLLVSSSILTVSSAYGTETNARINFSAANLTFGSTATDIISNSLYYGTTQAFGAINIDSLRIGGSGFSTGSTLYDKITGSIAAGQFSSSIGYISFTGNGSSPFDGTFTWSGSLTTAKLSNCSNYSLLMSGSLNGFFGPYSGKFTPTGTDPVLDVCTNQWTSSGADYRVLAVLADTQYATISDLIAPGFSGSLFYQGPNSGQLSHSVLIGSNSSSISKDFAIWLKSSNSSTAYGTYAFSIDPSSPKFITNVFGKDATAGDPDEIARGQKIEAAYLYKVFENQLAKVSSENTKWFISGSYLPNGSALWAGSPLDFTDDYSRDLNNGDSEFSVTHATTPWIISQAVASWDGTSAPTRYRLFKVHTLSDGTNTNTSYKVEISNVKLAGQVPGSDWGSFTLTIRAYSDTDKRPKILETFQNLNLDPDSSNYIARRIGDRYNYINFAGKIIEFGTYTNLSKYVRIEMSTNPWALSAVPAGFEALSVPINSSMAHWVVPMRYTRASIYGVDPGKYPSGIAFNDAPTGADAELSALYPTSSTGNGVSDDNKQYFAPLPSFGAYPSIGRNTVFALDQTIADWGFDAPASTGSYLEDSLSGSIPFIARSDETTIVKMRKFVVGFQGGFDGQSPSIPINIGSDIIPGNTQGLDCTDINSAGSIAYKQCIAALGNADEFDINLIALPGIVHEHHSYVTNLVVEMCEKRGDCFYIMDLHVTPATEGSVGQIDNAVYYASQYDTNYAAAYYPWIKILDTNTNKIITVPPSVVLPAVYAANDKVSAEWFAPAGLNRGGITQAVQVCDRTTHEERDTLYEGKVNPIAAFPGQGICVWGQKTLQNEASALDRVNVRRLLIAIKKFFASTAKYLVFEQNVASTRNKFLAIVNPYLESIQQRSGLYAFQVVMDETNNTPDIVDRNILYGQIYLKPAKTAEFIILDFNILPTGASFPGA
jgi:hypothetical protein